MRIFGVGGLALVVAGCAADVDTGALAAGVECEGDDCVVLRVPGDFRTIRAAIAAAPDGATIHIAAGAYDEPIVIAGKNLHLRGDGPSTVLVGTRPATPTAAKDALGVITFTAGGGGSVAHLAIDGADAGVRVDDAGEDAQAVSVDHVRVTHAEWGVLSLADAALAVEHARISASGQGISLFTPDGEPDLLSAIHLEKNHIFDVQYGVLVVNKHGACDEAGLHKVEHNFIYDAVSAGILVSNSGACIFDNFVNRSTRYGIVLYKSLVWVHGNAVNDTRSLPNDTWGDGVAAFQSNAWLYDNHISFSERGGVANFGSVMRMTQNLIRCSGAWDLELEKLPANYFGVGDPSTEIPGAFQEDPGNQCGCHEEQSCIAVSAGGLAPPAPLTNDWIFDF